MNNREEEEIDFIKRNVWWEERDAQIIILLQKCKKISRNKDFQKLK